MSLLLSAATEQAEFEQLVRSSDVYSEPPSSDYGNAAFVALMMYFVAALGILIHYVDKVHFSWLWPDGWLVFIDLAAITATFLGTWTVLWAIEMEWCWRRRYRSFVYWLYRHDGTRPPWLAPAIYAGESVNPTNRVQGHQKDGREHWRKRDWARNVDMRIIRVTRPSRRHAVEDRAKLYGSFHAMAHDRFWGGAEGFMGAKVTNRRKRIETIPSLFWVAVWSWGAICFPRHYGFGRTDRSVWGSFKRRLAR